MQVQFCVVSRKSSFITHQGEQQAHSLKHQHPHGVMQFEMFFLTGHVLIEYSCFIGPENFLLFADLNTLKMLSLDPGTEETVHTLHYGATAANYVGLVYDETTDTIYWNDQTRFVWFEFLLGCDVFRKKQHMNVSTVLSNDANYGGHFQYCECVEMQNS